MGSIVGILLFLLSYSIQVQAQPCSGEPLLGLSIHINELPVGNNGDYLYTVHLDISDNSYACIDHNCFIELGLKFTFLDNNGQNVGIYTLQGVNGNLNLSGPGQDTSGGGSGNWYPDNLIYDYVVYPRPASCGGSANIQTATSVQIDYWVNPTDVTANSFSGANSSNSSIHLPDGTSYSCHHENCGNANDILFSHTLNNIQMPTIVPLSFLTDSEDGDQVFQGFIDCSNHNAMRHLAYVVPYGGCPDNDLTYNQTWIDNNGTVANTFTSPLTTFWDNGNNSSFPVYETEAVPYNITVTDYSTSMQNISTSTNIQSKSLLKPWSVIDNVLDAGVEDCRIQFMSHDIVNPESFLNRGAVRFYHNNTTPAQIGIRAVCNSLVELNRMGTYLIEASDGNGCIETVTIDMSDYLSFTDNGTLTINNSATITTDKLIEEDLIIQAGTYTIDGATVKMANCASKVIVKNGAVLRLENAELTGCLQFWEGVEVEPGGMLEMIGGEINNAIIGVKAPDDALNIQGGNSPSKIEDCLLALLIDGNNTTMNNSIIQNTNFSVGLSSYFINQNNLTFCGSVPVASPMALVQMNGSQNRVIFDDCLFRGPTVSSTSTVSYDVVGIHATNSAFTVFNDCRFETLLAGIYTGYTGTASGTTFIGDVNYASNKFNGVDCGIISLGDENMIIENNTFEDITGTGIYLLNTGLHEIKHNAFLDVQEGIVAANSSMNASHILNNRFTYSNSSASTIGAISALDQNQGLKMTCNIMDNMDYDITVEPTNPANPASINNLQANPNWTSGAIDENDPASNKFATTTATDHFYITNVDRFNYIHHNPHAEPRYKPTSIVGNVDDPSTTADDATANITLVLADDLLPANSPVDHLFCNTECHADENIGLDCEGDNYNGGSGGGGTNNPPNPDPCVYDVCNVCNGNGIPTGYCDCNYNIEDECGVCGGSGIPTGYCDCDLNTPITWYADADGDGDGNPNKPRTSCTQPTGYVSNNNDPDDYCAHENYDVCGVCNGNGIPNNYCACGVPAPTYYADTDGDGMGDPNNSTQTCNGQPAGYVKNKCDSDDTQIPCQTLCRNTRLASNGLNTCAMYAAPTCFKCLGGAIAVPQGTLGNGGHWGLLNTIYNAPRNPMTINRLKKASPYLSDKVLIALVQSTKMEIKHVHALLMDNAPLTHDVWQALEARDPAYPPLLLRTLQRVQKSKRISERTKLEMQLSSLEYQQNAWLQAAVRQYVADNELDKAIELLKEANTIEAKQQIIRLLLMKKDFRTAAQELRKLPNDANNKAYKLLQSINIRLQRNKQDYTHLQKRDLVIINGIARGGSTSAGYARQILTVLGHSTPPLAMPKRKSKIQHKQRPTLAEAVNSVSSLIHLYPNPANNRIQIDIDESLGTDNLQLAIYDLMGRLMMQQTIQQANQSINTSHLPDGMYLYHIQQEGKTIHKDKLLIVR